MNLEKIACFFCCFCRFSGIHYPIFLQQPAPHVPKYTYGYRIVSNFVEYLKHFVIMIYVFAAISLITKTNDANLWEIVLEFLTENKNFFAVIFLLSLSDIIIRVIFKTNKEDIENGKL